MSRFPLSNLTYFTYLTARVIYGLIVIQLILLNSSTILIQIILIFHLMIQPIL